MKFKCRSCQSTNIKEILNLGNQPWGNDFIKISDNKRNELYPLIFVICADCKMSQINFTVPKEKMFKHHSYMSGTTKTLSNHFKKIYEKIINKNVIKNQNYILDIGGNDGTFLINFKKNNIKTLNVDSGVEQAKISNANGIECINDFFNEKLSNEIYIKYGKASVIHGSGILFHLEELDSAFKGIKNLLKDDGILVAEFISLKSMLQNLTFDQIYHEHLLYYSLTTFQKLLDKYELEIFDADAHKIHGGSLVAYIQHKKYKREKTENFLKLSKEEIDFGILKDNVYEDFAKKIKNFKLDMNNLLLQLKSNKKKIFALGAPVKGSTIINYLNLTEKTIEYSAEVNPYKFNTYFPGTKIPVLDQNTLDNPDYYLLLSWNFQDEIISKMVDFKKSGGKFIIPFPAIQIL